MPHFIILILIVLVLLLAFGKLHKQTIENQNRIRRRQWVDAIPGPTPFPIISFIGNIFQLTPLNKVRKKFFQLFKEYPDCFKFVAFSQDFVVLTSAPVVQSVLKSSNLGHLHKSFIYDILKPFMTSGLIVANGTTWQPHRRILNPSMTYHTLKGYMKTLNCHSKKLVANLNCLFADGLPHEINKELNCSFLEIICELITGSDAVVDASDVIQYHHNFQRWKAVAINRLVKPWLLIDFIWKLHPMSTEYSSYVDKMNTFAKNMYCKYQEFNGASQENGGTNPNVLRSPNNNDSINLGRQNQTFTEDFRSMLDELVKGRVAEEQILEEINSLLLAVAGHETVATTMHFFCVIMASKKEFQEECRQEVDSVFNDSLMAGNNFITFEALSNLKYLERCILETLRLYPPVYAYIRQLQTSLSLDIKGCSVELTPGTNVVIVPSAMQMNPRYFPSPKTFDPDRFLPEECARRPVGCYIPFSDGPRGCLGRKFAMMELKIMAAFIIRFFELETSDSIDDIPIVPYVTLTPKRDYVFTFKKRFESMDMNCRL